jgi:hypothetical protein
MHIHGPSELDIHLQSRGVISKRKTTVGIQAPTRMDQQFNQLLLAVDPDTLRGR